MTNKNLLIFLLLFPLLCGCGKQTVKQESIQQILLTDSLKQIVSIDTVQEVIPNNELLLNGRVTFDAERVAHVYPIFGGTITEVNVETGDFIKKGDVLAVIRSSEVADFEKQEKEAEQQVLLSKRNLGAVRDMFRCGMASDRDVLQAEQEAANAFAEQKRIKEVYSINHITGNSTYEVRSPVSGFVINKNISKNMQIRSDRDDEMFTVSGLGDVWVMADVYEGDISKVKEGADVRITTLAYGKGKEFTGQIDKVYNILDDESKTMKVRVRLNNKDYLLKPGMFTNVYVQCRIEGEVVPRIPARAVIFDDGKQYVILVGDGEVLQIRQVAVLRQTDKYCFLKSGLKAGDRVIHENAILLYNALK